MGSVCKDKYRECSSLYTMHVVPEAEAVCTEGSCRNHLDEQRKIIIINSLVVNYEYVKVKT